MSTNPSNPPGITPEQMGEWRRACNTFARSGARILVEMRGGAPVSVLDAIGAINTMTAAVPALLAEVERLREENQILRDHLHRKARQPVATLWVPAPAPEEEAP